MSYLEIISSDLNYGQLQITSKTNATILHVSGRDIKMWHDELTTSSAHSVSVRTYLIHRAEMHDVVRETIARQKEDETARYDRGIFRHYHHVTDLVMLCKRKRASWSLDDAGSFEPVVMIQ